MTSDKTLKHHYYLYGPQSLTLFIPFKHYSKPQAVYLDFETMSIAFTLKLFWLVFSGCIMGCGWTECLICFIMRLNVIVWISVTSSGIWLPSLC